MKFLAPALLVLFLVTPCFSEIVVTTLDGRTFRVPVDKAEVAKIEFEASDRIAVTPDPSPKSPSLPTEAKGFAGNWYRTENGKTVEYMDITETGGEVGILFRTTPGGSVTSRAQGTRKGDNLEARNGENTRVLQMQLVSQDRISYRSTDAKGGGHPWTCTWVRR